MTLDLRLDYNVSIMISAEEIVLRLLLGAVIGGIIGLEREFHGRAAGLRTQLIVCLASVLIMIVSENYYFKSQHLDPSLRIDPARIAAGALIGIGFLGAGVIVKSGVGIRGLTTAASIWIVSAIGLAIGGGLYFEAFVTFTITIVALVILRRQERSIKRLLYKTISVSAHGSEATAEDTIRSILLQNGIHIHSVDYERSLARDECLYTFSVSTRDSQVVRKVFLGLGALKFVKTVHIDSGDRIPLS